MSMTASLFAATSLRARLGVVPVLALAVALGWLSVKANMARSCAVQDTPYLPLCDEPAEAPDAQTRLARLRERVAASPGDTPAYVQLAHFDRSAQRPLIVAAASRVAPQHPQVRMAEALLALEQQDWNRSATSLVAVVERYPIAAPAQALARMVGAGQAEMLARHITPGTQWFHRVMAQMHEAGVPLTAALPLVERAHSQGVIDLQGARPYLRQLKAAGHWGDAYALWLALRGARASLLLNASFDQALETDGFDWEYPAAPAPRPSLVLAQPAAPRRGVVLELGFTGRPLPVPLLRQHVFLGEGRYVLRGQYRTAQLRSEQGLIWAIRCTSAPDRGSRASSALADTAGAWQAFEATLDVPPACGSVVSLQLETFAPAEAQAGIRGKLYFDDFQIEMVSRPVYASNRITPLTAGAPPGR